MRPWKGVNPFALATAVFLAISCAEDYGTGIVPPSRTALLEAVTPEVAASIGPDGKFEIQEA